MLGPPVSISCHIGAHSPQCWAHRYQYHVILEHTPLNVGPTGINIMSYWSTLPSMLGPPVSISCHIGAHSPQCWAHRYQYHVILEHTPLNVGPTGINIMSYWSTLPSMLGPPVSISCHIGAHSPQCWAHRYQYHVILEHTPLNVGPTGINIMSYWSTLLSMLGPPVSISCHIGAHSPQCWAHRYQYHVILEHTPLNVGPTGINIMSYWSTLPSMLGPPVSISCHIGAHSTQCWAHRYQYHVILEHTPLNVGPTGINIMSLCSL